MDIPSAISAELALTRQAIALSVIRQNARIQKDLALMVDQAATSVPPSTDRGLNVNFRV